MAKKKQEFSYVYRFGEQAKNVKLEQVKDLQKQPVPDRKKDTQKKIIKWETDRSRNNDFPQQLIQHVYNSPVGSAALDVHQEFVEGGGLVDEAAGETVIDGVKETLNDLHALLSSDLVFMWGFSFIQRYDSNGKPTERQHLPFEETRLGLQDKAGDIKLIYHNPYYGIKKDFDDKQTTWFYDFNPDPTHVRQQMKDHEIEFLDKAASEKAGEKVFDPPYPGQVFWKSIEKPLARVYPQPFYYSSINWFQVDAEIQEFHERNIKNNMLLSVMISMFGDPSAPAGPQQDSKQTTDKNLDQPETLGERFDRQMKQFAKQGGGVLALWALRDEERAKIDAFPTNSHHDLFIALQNITADQISIGTKVPRILIGIGTAGKLGDTQEILNAIRVMQGRTQRMRNLLKRCYEEVFEFVTDGTIKNINPVNVIPEMVWKALTLEEQRKYIEENFNVELITDVPEEKAEEFAQIKQDQNLASNGS